MGSITEGNWLPTNMSRFLLQVVIIVSVCQGLGRILKRVGVPSAVSDLISGVLLGPTALCRIGVFKDNIFPAPSLVILEVIATLALTFFMFLVGVEMDLDMMLKNFKSVVSISVLSTLTCFAGSAALALGFVDNHDYSVATYGTVTLLLGIMTCSSALPLLAKILNERGMLHKKIGSISLAISVSDEVISWALVGVFAAFAASDVNIKNHKMSQLADDDVVVEDGDSLSVVWTILLILGQFLFVFIVLRPCAHYLGKRAKERGAISGSKFLGIMLMLFANAYLSDAIGIGVIIGALEVGLIVPRRTPLHTALPVMLENLVSVILLPLFFALSGLRTNFGLIDSGEAVGFVVATVVVATVFKIFGIFVGSIAFKFPWRQSLLVSTLLATKGLSTLIIANIGYAAGVLSDRFFAICALTVLITTVQTIPLVKAIEPCRRIGLRPDQNPDDVGEEPELGTGFDSKSDGLDVADMDEDTYLDYQQREFLANLGGTSDEPEHWSMRLSQVPVGRGHSRRLNAVQWGQKGTSPSNDDEGGPDGGVSEGLSANPIRHALSNRSMRKMAADTGVNPFDAVSVSSQAHSDDARVVVSPLSQIARTPSYAGSEDLSIRSTHSSGSVVVASQSPGNFNRAVAVARASGLPLVTSPEPAVYAQPNEINPSVDPSEVNVE